MGPPEYPYDASMLSVDRFVTHNRMIEQQRKGRAGLVRGHKKDLVVSTRMAKEPGKVAIYGWQDAKSGKPIQPLSLKHEASYADYSHGIGFVHTRMTLDGVDMALIDFLADPALAGALSDEGPITVVPSAGVPPADTPPPPGPSTPIDYDPAARRALRRLGARRAPRRGEAERRPHRVVLLRVRPLREETTSFEGLRARAQGQLVRRRRLRGHAGLPASKARRRRARATRTGLRASISMSDAKNGGAWHEAADVKAGKWQPQKGDLAIFQRSEVGTPSAGWERHVARIDVPPDDKGTYCTIGGNEGPSPGSGSAPSAPSPTPICSASSPSRARPPPRCSRAPRLTTDRRRDAGAGLPAGGATTPPPATPTPPMPGSSASTGNAAAAQTYAGRVTPRHRRHRRPSRRRGLPPRRPPPSSSTPSTTGDAGSFTPPVTDRTSSRGPHLRRRASSRPEPPRPAPRPGLPLTAQARRPPRRPRRPPPPWRHARGEAVLFRRPPRPSFFHGVSPATTVSSTAAAAARTQMPLQTMESYRSTLALLFVMAASVAIALSCPAPRRAAFALGGRGGADVRGFLVTCRALPRAARRSACSSTPSGW